MPDTGAPWNIPYVDDSDLVRDFPTADEAQALAIAAGLTSAAAIKQFKFATDSTARTTSSTSFVSGTIELAFTPTAANSLLEVRWTGSLRTIRVSSSSGNRNGSVRLVEVSGSPLVGAENAVVGRNLVSSSDQGAASRDGGTLLRALLTAGSTSARTYRLEFSTGVSTNSTNIDNDEQTGLLSVTEYGVSVL